MGRVAQASLASVDLLSLLLHLEPLRSEAGHVRKDSFMAVTQQLARLTTDELARCRRSVDALHQCARSSFGNLGNISTLIGRQGRCSALPSSQGYRTSSLPRSSALARLSEIS